MKNIPLAIIALILIASISACDIITPPYRENVVPPDTTNIDTTKPVQKVLLIDYTGYRCGNCPKGAESAARLHDIYKDKLVIIAMHVGKQFAEPDGTPDFTVDFRTLAGEQLYNDLKTPGQPAGTVNYVPDGPNGRVIEYSSGWGIAIPKQLALTPKMSVKITPSFSLDSVLSVKAEVKYVEAGTNQRIAVYLIEDSVKNAQVDYRVRPIDIIKDFTQRHVFRSVIGNGDAFGTPISGAIGETVTKNYTFDFKGLKDYSDNPISYNPRHCSVVVSVNDVTTKYTLQVEEAPIFK